MIMGNDWRNYNDFDMELNGQHWQVQGVENMSGYLVYVWHDDDESEDDPVPKFYYSLRNGDVEHQDIQNFCPGFSKALDDPETVFWSHD